MDAIVAAGPFMGVWVLDPTRAEYGGQPAPVRGVYTMRTAADEIVFHVQWTDAEGLGGSVRALEFRAATDGSARPLDADATLTLRLSHGEGRLVTQVRRDDELMQESVRTVDGDTLTVVQSVHHEGTKTVLTSVYRRAGVKQVIVYRRDLKMRKGKIAAQVAHASLRVFFAMDEGDDERMVIPLQGPVHAWARGRFAKVVLSVETEEDLLMVHRLAREHGIPTSIITDAGKTEFGGVPTRTTVAVGPWASPLVDAITGPHGAVATKLA